VAEAVAFAAFIASSTRRISRAMPEPTPEPPRRRRRFTLSLRVVMLVVLILGGLMGWRARRASIQRRSVAAVEWLGGSVSYDWQYPRNAYLSKPALGPSVPAWLRRAIGDEYFQEVAQVNLPAQIEFGPQMGDGPDALDRWAEDRKAFDEKFIKPIDDDQLACLDGLDRLQGLVLQWNGTLKPEGLARLEGLAQLKELHAPTQLDAGGLARLGRLTNLETLAVTADPQAGSDLAFLDRLPKLRSLVVGGAVSEANLAQIGRRDRLEFLTFSSFGRKLSDAGLAHLGGLKALKFLNIIGGAGITDQGLAHLEGLSNLETLFLGGTPVNKAGLDHFRKLPKLVNLMFPKGAIDQEVIDEFRAARPGLAVNVSP
jgi:hypothetical protein